MTSYVTLYVQLIPHLAYSKKRLKYMNEFNLIQPFHSFYTNMRVVNKSVCQCDVLLNKSHISLSNLQ